MCRFKMRRFFDNNHDNISNNNEDCCNGLENPMKMFLRPVRVKIRPWIRGIEHHNCFRHKKLISDSGEKNVPCNWLPTLSDGVECHIKSCRSDHQMICDVQVALKLVPDWKLFNFHHEMFELKFQWMILVNWRQVIDDLWFIWPSFNLIAIKCSCFQTIKLNYPPSANRFR